MHRNRSGKRRGGRPQLGQWLVLVAFAMMLSIARAVLVITDEEGKEVRQIEVNWEFGINEFNQHHELSITEATIHQVSFDKLELWEVSNLPMSFFEWITDGQFESLLERCGLVDTLNQLSPIKVQALSRFGDRLDLSPAELAELSPAAFKILDPWRTMRTVDLSLEQFEALLHYTPNPAWEHEFRLHHIANRRVDLLPNQIARTVAVNVIGSNGERAESLLPAATRARLQKLVEGYLASDSEALTSDSEPVLSETNELKFELKNPEIAEDQTGDDSSSSSYLPSNIK